MNFRTIVKPDKPDFLISHRDRIVSIGSCFSQSIGKKFSDYKFNINVNPFGQQYNPFSIANSINRLLNPIEYTKDDLVYHEELFHSFDHHGSYSKPTVEETLKQINGNLIHAHEDLKNATILFLTFGTSHVFRLNATGKIVSNNHKMPGALFTQELMKPDSIVTATENALNAIRKVNSKIKIIFTISPVRYLAFGAHENSVSKSYLFTSIHELQTKFQQFYYFPAYEIVIDDLRDYRFYADDMLHPNSQATDYVWNILCETIMSKQTEDLMKEIGEIVAASRHKPRNPASESHKKFLKKYMTRMKELSAKYGLDFSEEERQLKG